MSKKMSHGKKKRNINIVTLKFVKFVNLQISEGRAVNRFL